MTGVWNLCGARVWQWCAMIVIGFTTGCDHPLDIAKPHVDVADLAFQDTAGVVVMRTVNNNRDWRDTLLILQSGKTIRLYPVPFDFKGNAFDVDVRDDIELRIEAEHPALIQWEPQSGYGLLRTFAPGRTRVRFLIWHVTHADFITPWLDVEVRAAPSSPTSTIILGD